MTQPLTHLTRRAALAAALLTAVGTAFAQASKPITLLVPYPAGGPSDAIARIVNTPLGRELGQQVLVDNLGGVSGALAAQKILAAPADGQMIFQGSPNELILSPLANAAVKLKSEDFRLIAPVADAVMVFVTRKDLGVSNFDELVALAKKSADKPLTYGSVGVGSLYHLILEDVQRQTGIQLQHVPYKGNAPAVNDLMAGHIPVMCNNLGGTLPYMQSGQIRILAQTGKARSAAAPDVPTFAEAGIAGLDAGLWMGLVAPKGTPKAAVDTLNQALSKVLATPALKERLAKLGATVLDPSPAAFAERIKADRRAWDPVLRSVDLTSK